MRKNRFAVFHLTFTSAGWQTTIATNGNRAITFWPYVGEEPTHFRNIYYRRYLDNNWEEQEIPLELPEVGLGYDAKNLSSVWGYEDNVYLVFAGMLEGSEIFSIYFVKIDFGTGQLVEFENITPSFDSNQEYPYVCLQRGDNLNHDIDDIYVVFHGNENGGTVKMVYRRAGMMEWSDIFYPGNPNQSSSYPCIAANPFGTIELTFEQPGNQSESQIYHQTFFPGADTFGAITHVSQGTHFSKRPVIACDIFGNVHITYISDRLHPDDPGNEEVFYRMFDAAPPPPTNVYESGDTVIWNYPELPDFDHFDVFLISDSDTNFISTTSDTFFVHNFGSETNLGIRAVDLYQQFSTISTESVQRGATRSPIAPMQITLGKNYPNPFNSYTIIPAYSNHGKTAIVEIYNLLGELVKRVRIKNNQTKAIWDGTNLYAKPVTSGVYLYRAVCNNDCSEFKMMVLIK
ncbi:MAG: hypothetical protein B6D58_08635 [candidate division Zixibacteria bacterium 4484_95]|nr:MAG: hypothetical protein B6D58_08635 [candidate division Zixibacteria bacterium 4484_95]